MVTLMSLAIFSIIFLIILSIVSNTGEDSLANIEDKMFLMNCPMPTFSARPIINATAPIDGFTVNYVMNNSVTFANDVFAFECEVTINQLGTHLYGVSLISYESSDGFFSLFDNAFAWIGYIYTYITHGLTRGGELLALIGFVLTPANFSILGFTIDDLSGIALMFIVLIYVVLYIVVGLWVYQSINPLSGGGS